MTAKSQWQVVMGTSGGPDAANTVNTGAFLGRFTGLKHIYSTDQKPVVQVSQPHPASSRAWQVKLSSTPSMHPL